MSKRGRDEIYAHHCDAVYVRMQVLSGVSDTCTVRRAMPSFVQMMICPYAYQ